MASDSFIRRMDAAIAQAAVALGAQKSRPGSWFDGFWDFVVQNRDKLERSAGWQLAGVERSPWSILCLAPPRAQSEDAVVEIHVFVEAKDYRAGVRAPWPVSSVVLGGSEPAQEGRPDPRNRPHDLQSAAAIRRLGYELAVGYWGPHAVMKLWQRDESLLAERAAAVLSEIGTVLRFALQLLDAAP